MAGKKTSTKKKSKQKKVKPATSEIDKYNKETKELVKLVFQRAGILFNYIDYPVTVRWRKFSRQPEEDWWGYSKMILKDGVTQFKIEINSVLLDGTKIARSTALDTAIHELAHVYSTTVIAPKSQYGPLGHHGVAWGVTYGQLLDALMA